MYKKFKQFFYFIEECHVKIILNIEASLIMLHLCDELNIVTVSIFNLTFE